MPDISFIDSHAHIYLEQFDEDLEAMITRSKQAGVNAVCMPNIDSETTSRMLDLATRFPGYCLPMMGLHPCSVTTDYKSQLKEIEEQLDLLDFIAVGEIGTDRYWDLSLYPQQVAAFEWQLGLAAERGLPVAIHSRDSIDENIAIVESIQDGRLRGVFHCFTGTEEQGRKIMDLGFYLGIGGVLTFKNSDLKEVMPRLGLSRVLLETDAPYLSPMPNRGKRNEPAYLRFTADFLAQVMGVSVTEVAEQTTANCRALFDLG